MAKSMDSFTLTEAKHEEDMKRGSDQLRNEVIYALIEINNRIKAERKAARSARKSSVKTLPSSAPLGDSLGASR